MKQRLARFARAILPPILATGLMRLSHRLQGICTHTFKGRYPTLAAVPCGTTGYDDEALAARIVASRRSDLETAGVAGLPRPDVDDNGRTLLPLTVATWLDRAPTVRVVDFGGGLGVGLVRLLNHLPELRRTISAGRLAYVIVETPAMCAAVEKIFGPICTRQLGPRVFWEIRGQLPSRETLFDGATIMNLASVLQYIERWQDLLTTMISHSPVAVIISETPVTDAPTYARMQCNMPRRRLGSWVFNRVELLEELRRHKYELQFQATHERHFRIADEPPDFPSALASFVFVRSK